MAGVARKKPSYADVHAHVAEWRWAVDWLPWTLASVLLDVDGRNRAQLTSAGLLLGQDVCAALITLHEHGMQHGHLCAATVSFKQASKAKRRNLQDARVVVTDHFWARGESGCAGLALALARIRTRARAHAPHPHSPFSHGPARDDVRCGGCVRACCDRADERLGASPRQAIPERDGEEEAEQVVARPWRRVGLGRGHVVRRGVPGRAAARRVRAQAVALLRPARVALAGRHRGGACTPASAPPAPPSLVPSPSCPLSTSLLPSLSPCAWPRQCTRSSPSRMPPTRPLRRRAVHSTARWWAAALLLWRWCKAAHASKTGTGAASERREAGGETMGKQRAVGKGCNGPAGPEAVRRSRGGPEGLGRPPSSVLWRVHGSHARSLVPVSRRCHGRISMRAARDALHGGALEADWHSKTRRVLPKCSPTLAPPRRPAPPRPHLSLHTSPSQLGLSVRIHFDSFGPPRPQAHPARRHGRPARRRAGPGRPHQRPQRAAATAPWQRAAHGAASRRAPAGGRCARGLGRAGCGVLRAAAGHCGCPQGGVSDNQLPPRDPISNKGV